MKVGWKLPRSATRFVTSGVCPRTVPDSRQPIWMIRANECARGRNSRPSAGQGEDLRQGADRVAHVGEHVRVRELASFGAARGPRGVDDGGQVGGDAGRAPPGSASSLTAAPSAARLASGWPRRRRAPPLDLPDPAAGLAAGQHLGEGPRVPRHLGDQGPGTGVAQDPLHLLGGGRLVDGTRDRAGRPDGESASVHS